MYPHRIRLRGPWEAEPVERFVLGLGGQALRITDGLPLARRVTLPGRWGEFGLADFVGVVRLRRRFGLPRRLDDWERVWLTCAGATGQVKWRLNGTDLDMASDPDGRLESAVTELLRDRNELAVDVTAEGPDGGLWGEVALEVRCRAYLREVQARPSCGPAGWVVHVAGSVVSEDPTDPLELYLLLGGQTQDYHRLQTDRLETPFRLTAPVEGRRAGSEVDVRVDLVNGATIWHTAETTVKLDG
jgi:hypothetical protein